VTGYREQAWAQIEAALGQNRQLRQTHVSLPADSAMQQMLRREQLEIIDRLVNLASLDGPPLPHPPVPEQAATAEQAAWIAENQDLWSGWEPGQWPAHDDLHPRGFVWEAMPGE
jgi:hypothetical protein